jgi:hypothetical protein
MFQPPCSVTFSTEQRKKETSWTCRKGGVKKGKRKKNWKTQNKGRDEEMNDKKARRLRKQK